MAKKIIQTSNYVNAPGTVRTDFFFPDFDVLIDNKGYDVIWERAIPCPCRGEAQHAQTVCKNCCGSGWVFINPTQIKAVAQSINRDTKFKEWSTEMLGTASFTVKSNCRLGFMDKLTIINSIVPWSEHLIVFEFEGRLLVRTVYPIQSITDIFKFLSVDSPLFLLSEEDYIVKENFIEFQGGNIVEGDSITVTYLHQVQYNILDLNHDVRNSIILDTSSREQHIALPIAAVGRRVHEVMNSLNFVGDNIFDNSYYD